MPVTDVIISMIALCHERLGCPMMSSGELQWL